MAKKKEIVIRSEHFDCPVDGALIGKLGDDILHRRIEIIEREYELKRAKIELIRAESNLQLAVVAYLTPNGRYDRRRESDLKKFGLDLVKESKDW